MHGRKKCRVSIAANVRAAETVLAVLVETKREVATDRAGQFNHADFWTAPGCGIRAMLSAKLCSQALHATSCRVLPGSLVCRPFNGREA